VSVLEHIPGVDTFFGEALRVLRSGGTLAFSVPLEDMDAYMLFPPAARRLGLSGLADAYVRRVHRAFKHVNLHEPEYWLGHVERSGFEIVEQRRIISRTATRLFDLGLPTALLSQLGRLRTGHRAVWHPEPLIRAWTIAMRRLVETPESDGSNLLVVARRP
jgi:hypothetical protein